MYKVIENHICGVYNHKKKALNQCCSRADKNGKKNNARAYGDITFLLSRYCCSAPVTTIPPLTRHPQPLKVGLTYRARTTPAAACLPADDGGGDCDGVGGGGQCMWIANV